MLTYTDLDPRLKFRKIEDLIDMPIVIKVNKFDEASAKDFEDQFQRAVNSKQPVIPILIDSFGGQVYSLLHMINVMKSANVPVATISIGKSMSCGSLLLSCGTEGYRFATEDSTILIHDVSSGSWGKVEEIKADAKETERLDALVYGLLDKNCGKPSGYFKNLVHEKHHADWYLTPLEAYKHNLVNKIGLPKFRVNVGVNITFE